MQDPGDNEPHPLLSADCAVLVKVDVAREQRHCESTIDLYCILYNLYGNECQRTEQLLVDYV